jgi:hypothetical protein
MVLCRTIYITAQQDDYASDFLAMTQKFQKAIRILFGSPRVSPDL